MRDGHNYYLVPSRWTERDLAHESWPTTPPQHRALRLTNHALAKHIMFFFAAQPRYPNDKLPHPKIPAKTGTPHTTLTDERRPRGCSRNRGLPLTTIFSLGIELNDTVFLRCCCRRVESLTRLLRRGNTPWSLIPYSGWRRVLLLLASASPLRKTSSFPGEVCMPFASPSSPSAMLTFSVDRFKYTSGRS